MGQFVPGPDTTYGVAAGWQARTPSTWVLPLSWLDACAGPTITVDMSAMTKAVVTVRIR